MTDSTPIAQWVRDLTLEIVNAFPGMDGDRVTYIRRQLALQEQPYMRQAWKEYLGCGDELFHLSKLLAVAKRIKLQAGAGATFSTAQEDRERRRKAEIEIRDRWRMIEDAVSKLTNEDIGRLLPHALDLMPANLRDFYAVRDPRRSKPLMDAIYQVLEAA